MNATARKISPSLTLIDETAEIKRSSEHILNLLAGPGSFSFALLNKAQNKYVALEAYNLQNVFTADVLAQTLGNIIESHSFLKENYDSVRFAYDSHRSTLIPEALFDAENIRTYIEFNHPPEKDDLVMSDKLKNIDTRNIFLFPEVLKTMLAGYYPKIQISHHTSALLESLVVQFKNESKPKLVLHISLTHFEIILVEGKHLRFYNTFRHQTTEDFIYYLLFVCEQLKLNPETLELVLIGEVERSSAIYSILHKYVRNIRFGERPDTYLYSQPLNTIPKHFYCNLFSQQLFR
jgi:hypothetical protein